jgi:hypothetical protein
LKPAPSVPDTAWRRADTGSGFLQRVRPSALFSADCAAADLSAAALVSECDRLAAAPADPNREGPGVGFDRIDAVAAIESCGQALARNPGTSRVIFNLARANDRAGRLDEAARLYRLAAEQGYTAARHCSMAT